MIKRTVLIVDDQDVNIMVLQKFLGEQYNTLIAHNGIEALEIMKKNHDIISAIILDIVMPKMNGYEFLQEIKNHNEMNKIPVIVSSGNTSEDDEVKALEMGAVDFIAKPYKPKIILQRLQNTISFRENVAILTRNERDELTGLYNKQFFIESVRKTMTENPDIKYDLICIGIERFKLVNEVYGVSKGDELLQYIAKLLLNEPSVKVCGRFSADEFYALYQHQEYSDEMFKQLYQKVNNFSVDLNISMHSGIYIINDCNRKIEEMCDRAKLAADVNKGKYNVYYSFYDDNIRKKLLTEQFIISNMELAIENDEFEVYYQPKYDLTSEKLAGAEALVRWIHPEKGIMSPIEFIPIFEKNGFITKLDRYVWKRVCKDMRCCIDKGYPLISVSINISRADIFHNDLADYLLSLLDTYQIPIRYLHLEITESAYTDNPDQIISVVGNLRKLGFIIEMDDFGSGYSSLNMLAQMPIDILKMDMKFVQTEEKNASGKGVMSFVVSLAKWLNLLVIAEGVESEEQITLLRSMDCNYVQGFYYARPMKFTDFEALLCDSEVVEMESKLVDRNESVVSDSIDKTIGNSGNEMLIVDDIETNRAVLAAGFMDDYKIVEMENGQSAWQYLEHNYQNVDIVMLDLLMPVMDGFQLLTKIRLDPRMKHLPVIITSQGDEKSEQRAIDLDADDFVSKPYNMEIIRHRVYNVVAGHRLYLLSNQDDILSNEDSPILKSQLFNLNYINRYIKQQKEHYDIVRLVNPQDSLVYKNLDTNECEFHSCFSLWNKKERCSNCISLRAFKNKSRLSKLEYLDGKLYYVICEYIAYGKNGVIIEMVNHIDEKYINEVFEKNLTYANVKEVSNYLEIDELTGIKNKQFINDHLLSYVINARARNRDLGIAIIKIDKVSDFEVIKKIAHIIETNIAISKGDFISYYSKDELIIVCRDIEKSVFNNRMLALKQLIQDNCKEKINLGCVNLSEYFESTPNELIHKAKERIKKKL